MPESIVAMGCRNCDATDRVSLPMEDVEAYMGGDVYIQDAFPFLNKAGREIVMQERNRRRGHFHWYLCPTCWEEIL
tara:strand:- start:5207 stop:5434 length:228 start_codon:yes stop_codon:yes gene_type:complete